MVGALSRKVLLLKCFFEEHMVGFPLAHLINLEVNFEFGPCKDYYSSENQRQ